MQRFAHYLKENKTGALPHQFICFDTETTTSEENPSGKVQSLKLFTAIYHRATPGERTPIIKKIHGYGPDALADFIVNHTRNQTCLYVFSANVWFDLRVSKAIELLIEDGFTIKSFFSNGKAFQLIMYRNKARIKFLNIQNFWPVSVKAIGDVVGFPKLDVDFDTVSDEKLLEYCYRDCEIIYRAMLYWFDFIKGNDLGTFGITLASQAFNAYRHRFMPVKIGIHDHERALKLERSGYFGGRTECFYIGRQENKMLYGLDINSMYPYVMKVNEYPCKLKAYSTSCAVNDLPSLLENYCISAECSIETYEPVYPVRHNFKTIFPVGRFITTLNTPSLKYALDHNNIVKVHRIALYEKANLFESWVIDMYSVRMFYKKEGNQTFYYLCKIMLNSLYGKFGQKSDEVVKEGNTDEINYYSERILDLETKKWLVVMHLGNYFKVIQLKVNEGYNSFPSISAHVTDYARMYLWQLMKQAGLENLYYTDTDSLYVNTHGYENLKEHIDDNELGKLALEKQSSYWYFFGCKDYIFQGKKTLKGIPKKSKRVGFRTYEFDMFPGVKSELSKGIDHDYTILRMQRKLKRQYEKGIVSHSGRVTPFVLSEF